MTLRKKPHLTASGSYNTGVTHNVHDVDMLGSRLHKKEIAEGISLLEAPPMVFGSFVDYIETPRGLRSPTSVWAVVRMGCVEIVQTHRRQDGREGFQVAPESHLDWRSCASSFWLCSRWSRSCTA
jgi:hypothetical protein